MLARRTLFAAVLAIFGVILAACGGSGPGGSPDEARPFSEVEKAARGTTVNFFMWGGDDAINEYVDGYVAPRLKERYGITLKRTPLTDTADAVNKLLNEKSAGKDEGTIDLVWINGENFATGAAAGLWYGPWAEDLPNAKYIDWESRSINRDFGYPVEGREAPWGRAQFVMIYDSAKVEEPPKNMDDLLSWARENPGKFTYPAPPDFTGNAFVEQAFYGVTGKVDEYQKPFDREVFDREAPKAYGYLNELEPHLWRRGETYPESLTKLNELFQDGQIHIAMNYNPQFAQRQVNKGLFPESTRTYLLDGGTLSNTHYVAIPFNAPNKDGARVVANFLESPEAQIEKQDPEGWGDLTVLDVGRLPEDLRKKLAEPPGPAALPVSTLQENQVPEARTKWLLALQEGWREKVLKE